MSLHLERQIHLLKQKLLSEAAIVEQAVAQAVDAVLNRDAELAQRVIEGDEEIDQLEVAVEQECLKTLALHQPVAADLRFVIAALKINNDLERMGDIAANIAKRARFLADDEPNDFGPSLRAMAAGAQSMIKRSLDALVEEDVDLARSVREEDDVVDEHRNQIDARVQRLLATAGNRTETWLQIARVAKHLERLADMATHVAEEVLYMADGEIARHRQ